MPVKSLGFYHMFSIPIVYLTTLLLFPPVLVVYAQYIESEDPETPAAQ